MTGARPHPDVPQLLENARELALADDVQRLGADLDHGAPFPEWVARRAHELGLLTLRLPEEYGGRELAVADYVQVLEQVAHAPAAVRVLVHGQNGKWELFHRAKPEERDHHLSRFARGDRYLSFAFSEPDRGTGNDIGTSATRIGEEWSVTGQKHLITWATTSDTFVVVAKTKESPAELTCFMVPAASPGLTIVPMGETLGMRGCGHGTLIFDDCRLPASALMGAPGDGPAIAYGFLDFSRVSLASSCVGLAQRALDLACDRADGRWTFGKPISERQAVQLMIADMQTAIEASRQLVRHAAERLDAGEKASSEAAQAKLHSMTMVTDVTDLSLRIHGGVGYTEQHSIERLYRDARSFWFEEGTREVQALVVARETLARRRASRTVGVHEPAAPVAQA